MIELAHAAGVPLQLTVVDQLGQRGFDHVISLAVQVVAVPDELAQHGRSGDHVADAHAGCEHLRERAHVHDTARVIDAGQRQERPTLVVKLVVVVVFEHGEAVFAGELE
jgi:hypothetical protein